jgi:glyoxylase-like metal-dependent hydrolase (beta-lactamase superfamily II)
VSDISIETFPVGALGCNCSILVDRATKAALVVDPGGDFDEIRARLERAGAQVAAIVHTHTHIDHVGATAPLQRWAGAPARIHEADRFLYDMLAVQSALVGVAAPATCALDGDLADGTTVTAGGIELAVIHTPGHTPGSVSFLAKLGTGAVVFAGDTLFRGGIGRTDLWGGDGGAILRSIKRRLLTLDEDTQVIAGHGPSTTIGAERRQNPFLL